MAHTLLLADDSVTIQRVIELTFADENIAVISVNDGDEAITAIETSPPDIVLADVAMPGRSGYDVARHVKQTPHLAHIPVVLLAGAFEPIDHVRAAAVGCDGVLSKPFEPKVVIGCVKELLTKGTGAPSEEGAAHEGASERQRAPSPAEIDSYFDQLDAAFARLAGPGGPERLPAMDSTAPGTALSYGSPPADFTSAPPRAEKPSPAPHHLVGAHFPPLEEAFTALLTAEQSAPSAPAPTWPAGGAISDELVEAVAQVVLARLSDHAVRERVGEIVSEVTERLVREEIESIKREIK